MDKEQQARLNFLDEAEDCFERMESVLLTLSSNIADPQQLDLALRSTHSVKGGAGMMGFTPLSHVAHGLEDFFKILRVRHHSSKISTEVETLLLKGVDCLRQISAWHRQGEDVQEGWLNQQVNPIFEQLRRQLGDVQDEDENALFAQNEDANPDLLIFEDGVETILDQFEEQLDSLDATELCQTLITTAEKLILMGEMANIQPFVRLCFSIQYQANLSTCEELKSLTKQALTTWRRSCALISRGSLDKLPSQLEGVNLPNPQTASFPVEIEEPDWEDAELLSLDSFADLEDLASGFLAAEAELSKKESQELSFEPETTAISDSLLELSYWDTQSFDEINPLDEQALAELQNAFLELETAEAEAETEAEAEIKIPSLSLDTGKAVVSAPSPANPASKMVRVPVEQLYQFNALFGKLILERNTINSRLEQMRHYAVLMRQRINQLEKSNRQVRQYYENASVERILPVGETPNSLFSLFNPSKVLSSQKTQRQFDTLEMDRYSDLQLISQEQIETIVQLEEVGTDIELGLQEMTQAMRELTQTTRSLQKNVTRTQMLPFGDVVKHFPRVVRDLSLQFGKQVNLQLEGEASLIDRAIVEALNAPLTHLLRNAFDHGIEDPETRRATGKAAEGTITIKAVNQGTKTIITVQDDGGGISLEKICDRLLWSGISRDRIAQMSEAEILATIFEPGFTTAERVSELSGRGVGMDVVRSNIRELQGEIEVKTHLHRGTTFILTLPSNISILRVMLLEQAGMIFAIPVASIRELLHLQPDQLSSVADIGQLTWHQEVIPILRLENHLTFSRTHKSFEMSGNPVINQPTALVVGEGTTLAALYLDRLWGEQEVTIRPIESPLPLPPGFIGSMILGDGRVLPLVDPLQLIQGCLESYESETQSGLKGTVTTAKHGTKESSFEDQVNRILIVDDSIAVRRYLAITLEKAGYQVEQAKDGQEAVDKLFGGLVVQAVICDMEMPRLDGYGVLEEVKSKFEFETLPIAMLTSRSNEKHRKLAMNLGASAYFSKPYNEPQLLQNLAELIASYKKSQNIAKLIASYSKQLTINNQQSTINNQQY